MDFKKRIFISSTLAENIKIREKIEKHFKNNGAEPMVYERNLTPDVKPYSYRNDVLEADFIILIVNKNYGNKTNTGLSGTHEEYRLAKLNKIPVHVYLQKSDTEKDKISPVEPNPLEDEVKRDNTSYYKFENEDDLFKRIQETTFTIAKETLIKKIENYTYDVATIENINDNYHYNMLAEILRILERLFYYMKIPTSTVNTDLFIKFFIELENVIDNKYYLIPDSNFDTTITDLRNIGDSISKHISEYETDNGYQIYGKFSLGNKNVEVKSITLREGFDKGLHNEKINEFKGKFEELKSLFNKLNFKREMKK